jgi:membrane-associated phospholipid phosphatase
MKPLIFQKLSSRPALRKIDAALLPIGAALWVAAIYARPKFMHLTCAHDPAHCGIASVLPWDRISVGLRNGAADRLSFETQYWAGAIAFAIPLLWILTEWFRRKTRRPVSRVMTVWILLFEATILNGVMNEVVRFVVQRPRPFVIHDPVRLGGDPAHYTSFYSGHTSFAALAGVILTLSLVQERAPRLLRYVAGGCAFALVVATAVFRVEAGRHYPTDVIAGALFGTIAALLVALAHASPDATPHGTGIA